MSRVSFYQNKTLNLHNENYEPMAKELILIRITGEDRPGLTASIMSILARYDVTILDIGQADIHSTLSLGILIRVLEENSGHVMKELLFKASELGVNIRFFPVDADDHEAWVKRQGKNPLLVACDIYRPAAIQQLKVCGEKLGIPVFEKGTQDPVQTAKEAVLYARQHGHDMVFLDTAGRLHVDEALMNELKDIKSTVKPDEIMLVVDAMTGQDAVNAAQSFNEWLDIDSVMLSKLDGDARGGAALSVRAVTGKPIKFAGMGEKLEDIEAFHPDRMASRILGMGDVLTLIDKVQANLDIDADKEKEMTARMKKGKFDFEDYLESMKQMRKMGGLSSILGMLPGMGINRNDLENAIDEKQLKRTEAIILSMTPEERSNPKLLTPQRKYRIAKGSGCDIATVNRFIKQFTNFL